ncbi:MAG: winged helix-turn-helix transcriptional regulator [Nocardia sp.]|nr:winged helix-turn-helix transcriptional regulator [Nocardia sp.]
MTDRPDLAAMLQPLVRSLIAAELPILEAHDISMWGYIVLGALDGSPTRSQAALAESINADKTRIIGVLDRLQERGLITRTPAPEDRRVRILAITAAGRRLRTAIQSEIQAGERSLLAILPETDRAAFLRAARTLHDHLRS